MRLGLFLGLFLALVSCVATVPAPASPITALLVVENQRTVDETIYLERDGQKGRRLGRVGSLSTDTLVLREGDAVQGQQVAFIAIGFAAGMADRSDAIAAVRGAVYRWQLAPSRGMAFLSRSAE